MIKKEEWEERERTRRESKSEYGWVRRGKRDKNGRDWWDKK